MEKKNIKSGDRSKIVDVIVEKLDDCQNQLLDKQSIVIKVNDDELSELNINRSDFVDELKDLIENIFDGVLVFHKMDDDGSLLYFVTEVEKSIQSALRFLKTCDEERVHYIEDFKYLLITNGENQLIGEISEIEKADVNDAYRMLICLDPKNYKFTSSFRDLKKLYNLEPN